MKISVVLSTLLTLLVVGIFGHDLVHKPTKVIDITIDETKHPQGIWKKHVIWKARWIKEWKQEKVWKPFWKKVWGPVEIKEWVPIPNPPKALPIPEHPHLAIEERD